MNSLILGALAVTKPIALAIGAGALVVAFVAFKVTRFLMKMVLLSAALTALGLAVWWLVGAP